MDLISCAVEDLFIYFIERFGTLYYAKDFISILLEPNIAYTEFSGCIVALKALF